MANERDFELLDDYIANRLTGGEREAFEQRLSSDPELKNEYQIQQKVIEGIRNARVAELKQMLNNTPVPPAGQSLVTKIATWTIVSGIVATGVYFLLDKNETPANEQQVVTENKVTDSETVKVENTEVAPAQTEEVITSETTSKETTVKKSTEKKAAKNTSSTSDAMVSQRPNVYDPSAELSGDDESNTRPDQPKQEDANTVKEEPTVKASTLQAVTDNTNKKYNFHYQLKDGKVYLYGSFERNLYEILEFFSGSKRTAFLYYKDNYYLLNEDKSGVQPLVPINDPVLRNKLNEYRSK